MTFTQFASIMYPCWILGITIFFGIYFSKNKDLLRIDKKALLRWGKYLFFMTAVRIIFIILFRIHMQDSIIPLATTGFVWWENLVFTIPLVILKRALPITKLSKILYFTCMLLSMFIFGSYHVYQGLFAATALSFYIPWDVKLGTKYGFGSTMILHCSYDFLTLSVIKAMSLFL